MSNNNDILTPDTLPENVRREIIDAVKKTHGYRTLVGDMLRAQQSRNLVKASQISAKMNELFRDAMQLFIDRCDDERRKTVAIFDASDSEERTRLEMNVVSIHLLCDAIEVCCMETDKILEKNTCFTRLDLYDKLSELCKECKEQVKFFDQTVDIDYSEDFGNKADRLYEHVMEGAGILIRKSRKRQIKKRKDAAKAAKQQ